MAVTDDRTTRLSLPLPVATNTLEDDCGRLREAITTLDASVATLDGNGKIPVAQIPAVALADIYVVASQTEMLALVCEVGDVAIRTDIRKSFILKTDGPSVLANWQELLTPNDAVTSVNGQTGVVTITSVTGNAGTATKLATARTINGVSFDGSANVTINAVDSTARIASIEKGAINGVATLDASGKIPVGQVPSVALVDTYVVASQTEMLALTCQVGDVAVRTDVKKTFILRVNGASTLANWQELLTPTDAVTSVNGQTGVVSITTITGNAATATKLATARTINGVSFDGTANVTINAVDSTSRIASSEKAAVNGVATLDASGKIPVAQIPSVAKVDTFVVATEAAMLASAAQQGDFAVRTDLSKTFILVAAPAATLANWQELLSPRTWRN